jgi:hypothetical protein
MRDLRLALRAGAFCDQHLISGDSKYQKRRLVTSPIGNEGDVNVARFGGQSVDQPGERPGPGPERGKTGAGKKSGEQGSPKRHPFEHGENQPPAPREMTSTQCETE